MKNFNYLMPFIQIAVWIFLIYIIFKIHEGWVISAYVPEEDPYRFHAEVSDTLERNKAAAKWDSFLLAKKVEVNRISKSEYPDFCPNSDWQYYLGSEWAGGGIQSDLEIDPKAVYLLFKQKNKTVEANNAIKKQLNLPDSNMLYEYASLKKAGFANRAIAIVFTDQCLTVDMGLWCGADQLGFITKSSGVQFVLIDTQKKQTIDTLNMPSEFVISIISSAPKINQTLNLQDYASDGKACEFYIPSYACCGITEYQIIGYNYHTDKLQPINFDLTVTTKVYDIAAEEYDLKKDTTYQVTYSGMANLPFRQMRQKSVIRYSTYYGHGDMLTNFNTFKFDAKKFCFRGTCISDIDRPSQWVGGASAPSPW